MTRRILLVDDDLATLKMTRAGLEHEGFEVVTATDGVAAVQTAQGDATINLVVLDVTLPTIDGFQVCQQLKASPTTARLPIIMMTGVDNAWEQLAERCLELGVVRWLRKPFTTALLRTRVLQALQESEGDRRYQGEVTV